MPNKQIVSDAGATTTQLFELCSQAAHSLREGQQGRPRSNSLGVLIDPHDFRSDLVIAREKIDAALALFDGTTWPGKADYDLY